MVTFPELLARFWNASLLEPVELLLTDVDVNVACWLDVPLMTISGLDATGVTAMAAEARELRAMKARDFMTVPLVLHLYTGCTRSGSTEQCPDSADSLVVAQCSSAVPRFCAVWFQCVFCAKLRTYTKAATRFGGLEPDLRFLPSRLPRAAAIFA